jgi:alkaline phosphatase
MPFTGFDTTWSAKPATAPPYLPDYDPDSASTGTAWATGQKTIDERISQGPSSAENVPGTNLKTVLELAQKRGMKVGSVSRLGQRPGISRHPRDQRPHGSVRRTGRLIHAQL